MTAQLMTLMLIVFSLAGLAIPSGILLQTTPTAAFAQSSEDGSGDSDAEEAQEVDDEATSAQDSSSDDNVLENDNDFGDDIAAIGQDNEADQDAVNVGVQEQDATQDIDQEQDAANVNVDFDIQVGQQVERQPPPPPEPPGPPPEERGIFCASVNVGTVEDPARFTSCFSTLERCEAFEEEVIRERGAIIESGCQRFEEPPFPTVFCFNANNQVIDCERLR